MKNITRKTALYESKLAVWKVTRSCIISDIKRAYSKGLLDESKKAGAMKEVSELEAELRDLYRNEPELPRCKNTRGLS